MRIVPLAAPAAAALLPTFVPLAAAQDLSALPTLSEVCALAADPNGILALLDGTAKGAWTLVGAALLLSMKWLVPQAVQHLRQRFLGKVSASIAGGILARVIAGSATSLPDALTAAVAEAKDRAGDTLAKVGATDATIRARVEGALGTLLASAPPAVVSAVLAARVSLPAGQALPEAGR